MSVVLLAVLGAALGPCLLRVSGRFTRHRPAPQGFVATLSAAALGAAGTSSAAILAAEPAIVFAHAAIFAVLLCVSIVDIVEYRLPDLLILPTLAAAVVATPVASMVFADLLWTPQSLIVATAAFGGGFLLLHLIAPSALGFGDVKLAVLLGLLVGWHAASTGHAVALVGWVVVVAASLGLGFALLRRARAVPFGPALSAGTWLVLTTHTVAV